MWISGPTRGEREKVAARVRDLLGEQPSPGGTHRRPEREQRSRARWEPSRAVIGAVACFVVLVLAITGWWYSTSQTPAVPVTATGTQTPLSSMMGPPATASAGVSGTAPPASPSSPAEIVVDVGGKVAHPGVYRLPPDSRVDDAVRAAGGATHGVSTVSLNLAALLHDGDKVVVGLPVGAPGAAGPLAGSTAGVGAGGAPGSTGPLDLNTATVAQLDALPGVGPVLAQHIIDWRTAHGRFTSVSQLKSVPGIGDAKFADLKALVTA